MEVICRRSHMKTPFTFRDIRTDVYACEICEKFVYKHSETIEYVKNYPTFKNFTKFKSKKLERNAKFSGYCFYMNTNI